ncbi:MAG: MFS transporter [Candidatus Tectimicrobiota bacterium]|nr:MAG: MFS transporter [Candidatus Tectomicrobia bacterium]
MPATTSWGCKRPPSFSATAVFTAFRHPDFRALWGAFVCSRAIQRMDSMVAGWLALALSHSPLLVGLMGAARFAGSILSPLAGVVADRHDRRQVLLYTSAGMAFLVLGLLFLVATRRLHLWHLFVATTLWGLLAAFQLPAQESVQADVLSGQELANGVALTNLAMNLTTIAAPVLGGALLAFGAPQLRQLERDAGAALSPGEVTAGVEWYYAALLGLHGLQGLSYLCLSSRPRHAAPASASLWRHLRQGLHHSRTTPSLWTPLACAGILNLTAFPLQFGLLPLFADEVFHVGASGLGLLNAAIGVGSLLGSLGMAALGSLPRAARLMRLGAFLWLALLLVFSVTSSYAAALGVLVALGVAQSLALTSINLLLLGTASDAMRGRIMGLRFLAVAPLPLGNALCGALAAHLGPSLAAAFSGGLGLLLLLGIAPFVPKAAMPPRYS